MKECPFKYKQRVRDDDKIIWKSLKGDIMETKFPYDVNGKIIPFDDIPYKNDKVFWCDWRNKKCVGESKCPIINRK